MVTIKYSERMHNYMSYFEKIPDAVGKFQPSALRAQICHIDADESGRTRDFDI